MSRASSTFAQSAGSIRRGSAAWVCDRADVESFITILHEYKLDSPYHHFMPPMVSRKKDVEDLANCLNFQANPPATGGQKCRRRKSSAAGSIRHSAR